MSAAQFVPLLSDIKTSVKVTANNLVPKTASWEMRVSVRPELIAVQLVPLFVVLKTPLLALPAKMAFPLATIEVIRASSSIPELTSVQVLPLSKDL